MKIIRLNSYQLKAWNDDATGKFREAYIHTLANEGGGQIRSPDGKVLARAQANPIFETIPEDYTVDYNSGLPTNFDELVHTFPDEKTNSNSELIDSLKKPQEESSPKFKKFLHEIRKNAEHEELARKIDKKFEVKIEIPRELELIIDNSLLEAECKKGTFPVVEYIVHEAREFSSADGEKHIVF